MNKINLILVVLSCGFLMPSARQFVTDEGPKTSKLKLQEGFVAEHLYSPSDNELGSWVSMCFDHKGRLITSDQYGKIYRMSIPPFGNKADLRPEILQLNGRDLELGSAHGLLYAFNSLYVMVNNRPSEKLPWSSGLFRLQDTNNDDEYDKITLLKELDGEGEHGPHSIRVTPDGKSLVVIAGNYTKAPEMDHYRNPKHWNHDNLLPEILDPRGHAANLKAPAGWIAKLDPEGKNWELLASGFRNAFDMVYNDAGDLFVYDADMEWDLGLPWYRPTRICHAVSGAEFGWRTGNGKWDAAFPDNLNAVINIGQGSPTNLLYLKGSAFPAKYQQSLLAFDWSFGIIHAIHLEPKGASYTASREEFLSGIPLPLTDGVIGPDGALYFLTGGRRIDSDLYRVSYRGKESTVAKNTTISPESQLRRSIERFHVSTSESSLDFILPNLSHEDAHIRFASRVALEHQKTDAWVEKVFSTSKLQDKTQGLLALARINDSNNFWKYALDIPFVNLSEQSKLEYLRGLEISLYRDANVAPENLLALKTMLAPLFPQGKVLIDRQLLKILVHLQEPSVLKPALAIMQNAKDLTQAGGEVATNSSDLILRNLQYGDDIAKLLSKVPPVEQTYYAVALSKLKVGWSNRTRKEYFGWYKNAFGYKGGNSYVGYLNKARQLALENVPENKREYFDKISGGDMLMGNGNSLKQEDFPEGPYRSWKAEDAINAVKDPLVQRNFKRGESMYKATTCIMCHQMNGQGGNVGPDLTQAGTRFSARDLMEAIVYPSKTISDQYAAYQFQLKDGSTVVGTIKNENSEVYVVSSNPYAPDYTQEINKSDVVSKNISEVSSMPSGLINPMNEEELKDLVAYILAGGNSSNAAYK